MQLQLLQFNISCEAEQTGIKELFLLMKSFLETSKTINAIVLHYCISMYINVMTS